MGGRGAQAQLASRLASLHAALVRVQLLEKALARERLVAADAFLRDIVESTEVLNGDPRVRSDMLRSVGHMFASHGPRDIRGQGHRIA